VLFVDFSRLLSDEATYQLVCATATTRKKTEKTEEIQTYRRERDSRKEGTGVRKQETTGGQRRERRERRAS